tara:strand:- start:698 stop:1699 length:1002 start_codon:yes stop_codon:yes gene_type:complete
LRKEKKIPRVRIGGLSIFVGFFVSIITSKTLFLGNDISFFNLNFFYASSLIGITFFILGLYDDIFQLGPIKRLIFQFILAIIISIYFFNISLINISFLNFQVLSFYLNPLINILLTFLWLVGITNAINWLDGLDGLAAGLVSIFSIGFMVVSLNFGNILPFIYSTALFGTSISFLKFNNFPAKIFMGDSGSYLFGVNVAILAIFSSSNQINLIEDSFFGRVNLELNVLFPLLILFIPLMDMILVISRRLLKGKSIFFPDRSHLHHRLMKLGFNEQKTVFAIYCLASATTLFSFTNVNFISVISFLLFLFVLIKGIKQIYKNPKLLKHLFNFEE